MGLLAQLCFIHRITLAYQATTAPGSLMPSTRVSVLLLSALIGGTILGTSDDHRLKRHHHHHHHHNHETASEVSEGPSPLSSTSTLDTDEESSSSGSSSPTATASGSSSATSSSSNGRRRQGRAPLFVTYEDRLEAILDKLEVMQVLNMQAAVITSQQIVLQDHKAILKFKSWAFIAFPH